MKKRYFIASLVLAALFGLSALSWGQEASFFDGTMGRIIRVCESCTTPNTPPCTAYIEVRKTDGSLDNNYNIACGSAAPAPCRAGCAGRPDVRS